MVSGIKRFILWVLSGILLLMLVLIGLFATEYYFSPTWLNDDSAFIILAFVIIMHGVFGLIRSIKHLKSCNNHKLNHRYGEQCVTRRKGIPVLPVIIVVIIILGLGTVSYKIVTDNSLEGVPEDVIEFGEKYPEAHDYVKNFNKYVGKDFDMNVSKEMSKSDIPLFIQWDKRWGYKNYGGNYIGAAGCGPTCLSMVACGLRKDPDINPYVVAEYAVNQGFYTYGQGTSWALMTEGAKEYNINVMEGNISSDYILTNLSSQSPMICSMTPGDFTKSGHYIVLAGIDSNGKIIVNDPNSPRNSKKHWDVDVLVSQMKGIWKYCN
ncbi:MAG: C39 family peptidase [Lachnospiraceae bacterium]|nr:C39 family peptidase [Lachnospiraceae bacterium]